MLLTRRHSCTLPPLSCFFTHCSEGQHRNWGDHRAKLISKQLRLKIPRGRGGLIFNHRTRNSTTATGKRARMVIQRQDFPLMLVQNTHWTTPSLIKHKIIHLQHKPIYSVNCNKKQSKIAHLGLSPLNAHSINRKRLYWNAVAAKATSGRWEYTVIWEKNSVPCSSLEVTKPLNNLFRFQGLSCAFILFAFFASRTEWFIKICVYLTWWEQLS